MMAFEATHNSVELRRVASHVELQSIEFLKMRGQCTANFNAVHFVRCSFIDGQVLTLEAIEFDKLGRNFQFLLRPERNHA